MPDQPVIVHLLQPDAARQLDGKTWQIHVVDAEAGALRLYPVALCHDGDPLGVRCPVAVGGERCGLPRGHEGTHRWAGGD